jgi:hypothetical protein
MSARARARAHTHTHVLLLLLSRRYCFIYKECHLFEEGTFFVFIILARLPVFFNHLLLSDRASVRFSL